MRKILPLFLVLLCGISAPLARAAETWPDDFEAAAPLTAVPEIRFAGPDGMVTGLQSQLGRIVILNFWATWCGPCVKEMPSLSKLQAELGGYGLSVVPVSMDRAGPAAVEKFFAAAGIANLPVLMEVDRTVSRFMKPQGLPLTLIIGRDGRELARGYGAVEWDAPEMLAFMKKLATRRD